MLLLTEENSKTLMRRETPAVANNSSSRSNSILQQTQYGSQIPVDSVFAYIKSYPISENKFSYMANHPYFSWIHKSQGKKKEYQKDHHLLMKNDNTCL